MIACPVPFYPREFSQKVLSFNRMMANSYLLREHSSRRLFESVAKAVAIQRLARALVLEKHQLKTKDHALLRARHVLQNDVQTGLELCPFLTRKAIQLRQIREGQWASTIDHVEEPLICNRLEEGKEGSLPATFCDLRNLLGLEPGMDEATILQLVATQNWNASPKWSAQEFLSKMQMSRGIEIFLCDFVATHPGLQQQIDEQARYLG